MQVDVQRIGQISDVVYKECFTVYMCWLVYIENYGLLLGCMSHSAPPHIAVTHVSHFLHLLDGKDDVELQILKVRTKLIQLKL